MRKKILISLIACFAIHQGFSQNTASSGSGEGQSFTLQQAVEYAVKNNLNIQNSKLDYQVNEASKNDIRAIGLPQITGSADSRYNQRTLFESLLNKQMDDAYDTYGKPNGIDRKSFEYLVGTEIRDSKADYFTKNPTYTPSSKFSTLDPASQAIALQAANGGADVSSLFGTMFNAKQNGTVGINASQILFSSDYLVGLQAAKALMTLSEQGIKKSEIDVKVAVSKAYYGVLVNRFRAKLIDLNIERLQKLFNDTKAMNQAGFVEAIDVDRLEVTLNNLISEQQKVKNMLGLAELALKFQMNYDIAQPIMLADTIIVKELPLALNEGKLDYNNRAEYSLLKSTEELNKLNIKRYKLSGLPTVAAYGNLQYQAFDNRPQFKAYSGVDWYRVTAVGVNMSVPLFTGGRGYYRKQMAVLNLQKTQNQIKNLEQAINLESKSASITYNNAVISINAQQKNLDLATKVLSVTKAKYEQGVGSNIEVLNAESSFKESQNNYFSALYDYYISKVDYDKAVGNIK